jgi:MFS transporter, UMF1 family
MEINTASFAMYTFSVSVVLQALLAVSISFAADHGNYRKKLLLTFAWVGAMAVAAFVFITKTNYLVGAILTIISNTLSGASFVLLNSFLPLLVRYHPDVPQSPIETPDLGEASLESQPLGNSFHDDTVPESPSDTNGLPRHNNGGPVGHGLRRRPTKQELTSIECNVSSSISARGVGISYGAALLVQIVGIFLVWMMHGSTWSLRLVLFMVGVWWATFTVPAAMWLRPRPGPPVPDRLVGSRKGWRRWFSYVKYSWSSFIRTFRHAMGLRDIVLFLLGWLLLSDAIATTSSTAILFAKVSLQMEAWALGAINVVSTLAGVLGAFTWGPLSRYFGLKPHQTILVCIALFEVIPLYGLLGYLPFVQRWGVFGLQKPWEMYPLAGLYGFVLGGFSSYCRAVYGELIPPGSEAAFYALYAITDKGSSFFGPSIVGRIIDKSGDIRPAFWFLAALVGLPVVFIYFVDINRGKRAGEKLAETIEGFEVGGGRHEYSDESEAERMLGSGDGADDEDDGTTEGGGASDSNGDGSHHA